MDAAEREIHGWARLAGQRHHRPTDPGGSFIQSEVGRANDQLIIEYHVPTG